MRITAERVLMYDLKNLLKMAFQYNFASGEEKRAIKRNFRSLEELSITFPKGAVGQHIETELDFVDMRVVDNYIKQTVNRIVEFLQEKEVIEKKEDIVRDLSEYCLPDIGTFAGIVMTDPTLYFGDTEILYPKGSKRTHQILIRYPDKIRKAKEEGKQFYMMGEDIITRTKSGSTKVYKPREDEARKLEDLYQRTKKQVVKLESGTIDNKVTIKKEMYFPSLEDSAIFDDMFFLQNKITKIRHYFGIWE